MNSPYDPFDMTRLMRDVDAAPSILNTKPWKFEKVPAQRIELRPNWERHLKIIDPRHRELVISCGAALFNLRLAIRVTGHDPVVWLLPDENDETQVCPHCRKYCGIGDMLASVEIITQRPHPATVTEQRMHEAIPLRHTIREPFSRPIPMNVLAELELAARAEGAQARLLHPEDTRRLLRWAARTDRMLGNDGAYAAELKMWTGDDTPYGLGVPTEEFGPEAGSPRYPPVRDLGIGWKIPRQSAKFEKNAQLIALETETDKPSDWLQAGQALQRLLLTATYYGVQTSFLTQELEVTDRKIPLFQATRHRWRWRPSAQMVIRVGQV